MLIFNFVPAFFVKMLRAFPLLTGVVVLQGKEHNVGLMGFSLVPSCKTQHDLGSAALFCSFFQVLFCLSMLSLLEFSTTTNLPGL